MKTTNPNQSSTTSSHTSKPQVQRASDNQNEETFNEHLTAIPKSGQIIDETSGAEDLMGGDLEYGEMNAEDAVESGYTDKDGHAVSMAKKDRAGTPTGAYTDIGAGRSSAVVHADPKNEIKNKSKNNSKTSAH